MLLFGYRFSSVLEGQLQELTKIDIMIITYYIVIQINKLYKWTQSKNIVMHWKIVAIEIIAELITGCLVSLGSFVTDKFWPALRFKKTNFHEFHFDPNVYHQSCIFDLQLMLCVFPSFFFHFLFDTFPAISSPSPQTFFRPTRRIFMWLYGILHSFSWKKVTVDKVYCWIDPRNKIWPRTRHYWSLRPSQKKILVNFLIYYG